MKNNPASLPSIRQTLQALGPPASLFSGLRIEQALAPENIILFRRTDTAALRPEGVSNNYHHRFELVIVLEKAGPVRIDRLTHTLQPGECALIFPNQFHHYLDVEKGAMEWLFVTFELRHPDDILALRDSPRTLDAVSLRHIAAITEGYLTRGGRIDALEISYRLSRLLRHLTTRSEIELSRRDIHSGDNVRDVILESINHYVRSHLQKAVTISDIATELGYSVSHLRAVFRDRLGISLGRYIRESRLSEAAQLLQSGDLQISDIGERCGFESLYAFSRAFRKAYGLPPRAYRQLVQAGKPLPTIAEREAE